MGQKHTDLITQSSINRNESAPSVFSEKQVRKYRTRGSVFRGYQ